MTSIQISVHYVAGSYNTSTVKGLRASSTMSDAAAVARLGTKLWGPAYIGGMLSARVQGGRDYWTIEGDDKAYACAQRNGLIEIRDTMPAEGDHSAIAFASGPRRALQERLNAVARHGRSACEGKLLVPGVPEAEGDEAALRALDNFTSWASSSNGDPAAFGVVFDRSDAL